MDWTTIVTSFLGSLGLSGGITGLFYFRENKHAKQLANDATAAQQWKELYEKAETIIEAMEARIGERDKKVDLIYKELRDEQKAHLETLQRLHEKELECKDLEYDKCYRPMCRKRIPQRDNENFFENENQQPSPADHRKL